MQKTSTHPSTAALLPTVLAEAPLAEAVAAAARAAALYIVVRSSRLKNESVGQVNPNAGDNQGQAQFSPPHSLGTSARCLAGLVLLLRGVINVIAGGLDD